MSLIELTQYFISKMTHWPVLIAVSFSLVLTATNLKSGNHQLFNLEPYPDGLFYVVPAWRWANGGEFNLGYGDTVTINPRILPFYSWILAFSYIVFPGPEYFYVINVGLGVVSIFFLYLTLREITPKRIAQFICLGLYLSHFHIIWLPTVPMAENSGLALLSMGLYGLFKQRLSKTSIGLTLISIMGLALTKYTFIGPAAIISIGILFRLYSQKKVNWLLGSFFILCLGAVLFVVLHISMGFDPRGVLTQSTGATTAVSQQFYSFGFIWPNLVRYGSLFFGQPLPFLWLRYPITTFLMSGVAVLGLLLPWTLKKDSKQYFKSLCLGGIFLAQLPLILPFYVVDARYLVLSIPLFACAVGLFIAQFGLKRSSVMLLVLTFASMLFTQRELAKQLVATNWLQRSQPWQYRAIEFLDEEIPSEDSYLVTALPPFLFELYSQDTYTLLPLSENQEFFKKKQYVWQDSGDYTQLTNRYRQLLAENKAVYITNAYITSESVVTNDYETLKSEFIFEEVAQGCDGTCNIYKLGLE